VVGTRGGSRRPPVARPVGRPTWVATPLRRALGMCASEEHGWASIRSRDLMLYPAIPARVYPVSSGSASTLITDEPSDASRRLVYALAPRRPLPATAARTAAATRQPAQLLRRRAPHPHAGSCVTPRVCRLAHTGLRRRGFGRCSLRRLILPRARIGRRVSRGRMIRRSPHRTGPASDPRSSTPYALRIGHPLLPISSRAQPARIVAARSRLRAATCLWELLTSDLEVTSRSYNNRSLRRWLALRRTRTRCGSALASGSFCLFQLLCAGHQPAARTHTFQRSHSHLCFKNIHAAISASAKKPSLPLSSLLLLPS